MHVVTVAGFLLTVKDPEEALQFHADVGACVIFHSETALSEHGDHCTDQIQCELEALWI